MPSLQMSTNSADIEVCDRLIEALLATAGIKQAPVNAFQLAAACQMDVVWDYDQPTRGRLLRRGGRYVVFLKPDDRPERLQWALAHELGEAHAWQFFDALSIELSDVRPQQREALANLFAQRLLLPADWFDEAAKANSGNLIQLKQAFVTASYELIANRLLDLPVKRVVTIWDGGEITRRRSNLPGRLPAVAPEEIACREELLGSSAMEVSQFSEHGRVSGWKLHESQWQREIVIWEPAAPHASADLPDLELD